MRQAEEEVPGARRAEGWLAMSPKFGGKTFPYDEKGMKAAEEAKKKAGKKKPKK